MIRQLHWLDYETTGLNAFSNSLLEIALAESAFDNPFVHKHIYHAVFHFPREKWHMLDPKVLAMHMRSGLLEECAKSTLTPTLVDNELFARFAHWGQVPYEERPVLAGSVVSFDKGFMAVHMPKLLSVYVHRVYDVSSLKLYCQSLGMERLPKAEAHRAVADIDESVAHLRYCDRWLYNYYYRQVPALCIPVLP